MKNISAALILFVLTISCVADKKTHKELESEVLCEILPQLTHKFMATILPSPQIPSDTFEAESFTNEDVHKYIEKQKDSVRQRAQKKNKIKIALNSFLTPLRKNDFDTIYQKEIILDRLSKRKIMKNELLVSTLDISLFDDDIFKFINAYEFITTHKLSAILTVSRICFNKEKNKAYFLLSPISCMPGTFQIIAEKKNNIWVLKDIIEN
jgi:hypothetical protein